MLFDPSDFIKRMSHSHLYNCVIPGLTSSLIGMPASQGAVRLFDNERDHEESIVPHSHRYDFTALVLRGSVVQKSWTLSKSTDGDLFTTRTLIYNNEGPGSYTMGEDIGPNRWARKVHGVSVGEWYGMKADEVHSIAFSRHARVLVFEGPQRFPSSIMLEPFVRGKTLHTGKVQPWMFEKESLSEERGPEYV